MNLKFSQVLRVLPKIIFFIFSLQLVRIQEMRFIFHLPLQQRVVAEPKILSNASQILFNKTLPTTAPLRLPHTQPCGPESAKRSLWQLSQADCLTTQWMIIKKHRRWAGLSVRIHCIYFVWALCSAKVSQEIAKLS